MGVGFSAESSDDNGIVGTTTFTSLLNIPRKCGVLGVDGKLDATVGPAGVEGHSSSDNGIGVAGYGATGVLGRATDFAGVKGESKGGSGVYAESELNAALVATTSGGDTTVFVVNQFGKGQKIMIGRDPASAEVFQLFTNGDVVLKGNLTIGGEFRMAGGDLAEEFGVIGELAVEPGCVVVLAGEDQIRISDKPYDRRVAGVVSGAGSYRPGLILHRKKDEARRPLALTGKVWCRVDADCSPIELGDLLTSSPRPGHAMRATDPVRAFGAVIGKSLGTLRSGCGLLPVLVALQ